MEYINGMLSRHLKSLLLNDPTDLTCLTCVKIALSHLANNDYEEALLALSVDSDKLRTNKILYNLIIDFMRVRGREILFQKRYEENDSTK